METKALLLVLLVTLSVSKCVMGQCYAQISQEDYPYCVEADGEVAIHWTVDDTDITFAIVAQGEQGYIAVGISEGGMNGADIAAYVQLGGSGIFQAFDYFAQHEGEPQLDSTNNVEGVSVAIQPYGDGLTTIGILKRPLKSCDPQDQPILPDQEQILIWAFGEQWGYHGTQNRGSFVVTLWPNMTSAYPPPLPSQTTTSQLVMPKYQVPTAMTSYMCTNFMMPNTTTYHIVQYSSIITSSVVHHMLMYACSSTPPTPVGVVYDCLSMPPNCHEPVMVWAPGTGAVTPPAEAGFRIGSGSIQYMTLQIHYNNINHLSNVVDSSGFQYIYTKNLRPYDMGVLTLGMLNFELPPGQSSVTLPPGWCPSECTSKFSKSLTITDNFLHMHQLGSKIITRHIRNNIELAPLGSKMYFDFEFQGATSVPYASRTLLPGDALSTTCTFDTSKVLNTTYSGPSTSDEMCFNFISYYPRLPDIDFCTGMSPSSNLSSCTSGQHLDSIDNVQDAINVGWLLATSPPSFVPYTDPYCAGVVPAAPDVTQHPRAAWAMIVVVPLVLMICAVFIWSKFGLPEERRALLAHDNLAGGQLTQLVPPSAAADGTSRQQQQQQQQQQYSSLA